MPSFLARARTCDLRRLSERLPDCLLNVPPPRIPEVGASADADLLAGLPRTLDRQQQVKEAGVLVASDPLDAQEQTFSIVHPLHRGEPLYDEA